MKTKGIFLLFLLALIVVFAASCTKRNSTNMSFVKTAKIIYIHNDKNIVQPLSNKETVFLKNIFHKRKMYHDNPSCGFPEKICIKFNDSDTFCIARDTCPIVYWVEKDCYIKLTEKQAKNLRAFLAEYGAVFPCI